MGAKREVRRVLECARSTAVEASELQASAQDPRPGAYAGGMRDVWSGEALIVGIIGNWAVLPRLLYVLLLSSSCCDECALLRLQLALSVWMSVF